jgi:hypothetical protein
MGEPMGDRDPLTSAMTPPSSPMPESPTILMLSPELPYPLINGTRIDIWGHILLFHQLGWRIVLVVCSRLATEILAANPNPSQDFPIALEVHVLSCNPRWSATEDSKTVLQIQALIDQRRPQVVWSEYAYFAPLANQLNLQGAKLWFRPHNFELAHNWEKMMETGSGQKGWSLSQLKQRLKWWQKVCQTSYRIFRTERQMHQLADRLFFISYSDRQWMSRLYGKKGVQDWLPPFLERPLVAVKPHKTPLDVLYISSNYTSPTHLSGVHNFLDRVIPAIETAMPGQFRFHVVGPGSSKYFHQYSAPNIQIHDFIEDLSSFLMDVDIACLPVTIGWGCKIKMIEALASGLPVIGSPQTFRGISATPNAYYVCETDQDFIAAFAALQNPETRKQVAQAGRDAYVTWLTEGKHLLTKALQNQALQASVCEVVV